MEHAWRLARIGMVSPKVKFERGRRGSAARPFLETRWFFLGTRAARKKSDDSCQPSRVNRTTQNTHAHNRPRLASTSSPGTQHRRSTTPHCTVVPFWVLILIPILHLIEAQRDLPSSSSQHSPYPRPTPSLVLLGFHLGLGHWAISSPKIRFSFHSQFLLLCIVRQCGIGPLTLFRGSGSLQHISPSSTRSSFTFARPKAG